jgi:NhaP-type Na+/H+ or K+/H+ antiporter
MEHSEKIIFDLGFVIVLGLGAQWLAWRLKFPSIVFLLVFGFLSGPVAGLIDPDMLFGDLLLPFVSISVALILFEGGLTLNLRELKEIRRVVIFLITFGVLITWMLISATAYLLIGINFKVSVLLGAILVVTGPTVIIPLLKHIRPIGRISDILKWEGIVIDPVGAMLAVIVFETILAKEILQAGTLILLNLFKMIFIGFITGYLFARLVVFLIRKFWIPDYMQETLTLAMVISAYMSANYLQPESGLIATTLMGIIMANQGKVNIRHILEFKENLSILIISVLFIILSARLDLEIIYFISFKIVAFLIILIVLVRPLSVYISTIGSGLTWREKTFLSWVAPRGIVAAAISSVFALRLAESEIPQSEILVPLTFIVIVGTVIFYGLVAPPLSKRLKVAQSNPQGLLIIGAHDWALEIGNALLQEGIDILMIDTNRPAVSKAKMMKIPSVYGSALSPVVLDEVNLAGIGRILALTSNDEVNSLAVLHYNDVFDKEELYQLRPKKEGKQDVDKFSAKHLQGRYLFDDRYDFYSITRLYEEGYTIKAIKITQKFNYNAITNYYGNSFIPLFIISEEKNVTIITTDSAEKPKPGQTLIALLKEPEKQVAGD